MIQEEDFREEFRIEGAREEDDRRAALPERQPQDKLRPCNNESRSPLDETRNVLPKRSTPRGDVELAGKATRRTACGPAHNF